MVIIRVRIYYTYVSSEELEADRVEQTRLPKVLTLQEKWFLFGCFHDLSSLAFWTQMSTQHTAGARPRRTHRRRWLSASTDQYRYTARIGRWVHVRRAAPPAHRTLLVKRAGETRAYTSSTSIHLAAVTLPCLRGGRYDTRADTSSNSHAHMLDVNPYSLARTYVQQRSWLITIDIELHTAHMHGNGWSIDRARCAHAGPCQVACRFL